MEDSTTNYSTIIISVLMAVVIIATVMIPIITATTQTTTTTEIDNEGEGWLKLGYNSGEDFDFEITNENSNITIGDQTGTMGDNIFYADSKNVIFTDSVQNAIFLLNTESSSVHKFSNTVSVENTEGTLNISDGTETVVNSESPTWAYIPDTAGEYGFFTDGGLNLKEGKPTVAVGSYAGVFAYNDTVVAPDDLGSLGLTMSGDYAEGEVNWVISSELNTLSALPTDTLEPAVLDFEPISLDPIDLGGSGSVGLMSADPSNGTQVGDLYYQFYNPRAVVVGYSSSIDWSTFSSIPDTVVYQDTTYNVVTIDSNAFSGCRNLRLTSLPEGLVNINGSAFQNCSNLALTSLPDGVTNIGFAGFSGCTSLALTSLPDGVTNINGSSFNACTSLALTSLPDGVTNIGSGAFKDCTNLKSLIIQSSPTIASNSFQNCTNLKQILNLGETEITTTSYGLNADSVQDHVTALGYIAPVSIHETVIVEDTSLSATLLKLLPVFMVLAVVIFIGYAMYRPDSEFIQSLKNKL